MKNLLPFGQIKSAPVGDILVSNPVDKLFSDWKLVNCFDVNSNVNNERMAR